MTGSPWGWRAGGGAAGCSSNPSMTHRGLTDSASGCPPRTGRCRKARQLPHSSQAGVTSSVPPMMNGPANPPVGHGSPQKDWTTGGVREIDAMFVRQFGSYLRNVRPGAPGVCQVCAVESGRCLGRLVPAASRHLRAPAQWQSRSKMAVGDRSRSQVRANRRTSSTSSRPDRRAGIGVRSHALPLDTNGVCPSPGI